MARKFNLMSSEEKIATLRRGLKNILHYKLGRCNICGKNTVFISLNPQGMREDLHCIFCESISRKRHLAKVINEKVTKTNYISEIPKKKLDIKIYNTDVNDSFYNVLYDDYEPLISSTFSPNYDYGKEIKDRVYCQNIECLTFEDDYFDLVITEDVFEHVRNYKKGFKEIFRVLKNGSYHIFTVPFYFDRSTLIRIDTSGKKDIHLLEPEYHGDHLAYRTFGLDMFDILKNIGFETSASFSNYFDQKYCIFDSCVFISKKL